MRTFTLLLAGACLLFSAPGAAGDPRTPTADFEIELDRVPKGRARDDLIDLFIREAQNQLRIDLVLRNERVARGRARVLYYLEDLRVRPGDTLVIRPEGDGEPYEAPIQSIEARFPVGKPPQIVITAFTDPYEPRVQGRPYPQLSPEGFQGKRELQEKVVSGHKTRLDDLITCSGDTPGDLRIRYKTLVTVEDVGKAFSTTYEMNDVRHRYTPQNGLQTRYFGERHLRR